MALSSNLWRCVALGAALGGGATPAIVIAQAVVQPIPGTTQADQLAEQMRALAANPRDLAALLRAGELSLKLDDLSGAASLFARAEQIDPHNARLKAGEGSVLVRSERPGQALRYFAMAQSYGLDPSRFAGDRGLAYDLIGEQERAQRDYRLALKSGPDAEIARRYALSLGISGQRDAALAVLDPLLRDTDRGAWRARAFVLAMAGDVPGAERIATTMMPPGMAEGLQPFFQRLPSLPAIDRAFAVHFGEVRATPERVADARLVPALAALGPDPDVPVVVATADPVAPTKASRGKRRQNKKEKSERLALAVTRDPVAALPPPPAYRGQPVPTVALADPLRSSPMNATARANAQALASLTATASAPTSMPAVTPSAHPARSERVTLAAAVPTRRPAPAAPPSTPAPAASEPTPAAIRPATPVPAPQVAAAVSRPVSETREAANGVATVAPVPPPTLTSTPIVVASTATADLVTRPAASTAATAAPLTTTAVAPPAASGQVPADRPVPAALASRHDDSILARIVAGLSIPASELGIPDMPVAKPVATPDQLVEQAKAKEARDTAAEKLLADKAAIEKAAADKRIADRKAAADKKALAEKKIADAKKVADAKAAAEEKKAARANPSRIWVQVAGGANESDLPKAWAAAKAKAPKAFAGKQGWSTPLRATNRVLAGPFKTDDDARDFVNALAKEGASAFPFTSDKGQQITRLPTR